MARSRVSGPPAEPLCSRPKKKRKRSRLTGGEAEHLLTARATRHGRWTLIMISVLIRRKDHLAAQRKKKTASCRPAQI